MSPVTVFVSSTDDVRKDAFRAHDLGTTSVIARVVHTLATEHNATDENVELRFFGTDPATPHTSASVARCPITPEPAVIRIQHRRTLIKVCQQPVTVTSTNVFTLTERLFHIRSRWCRCRYKCAE